MFTCGVCSDTVLASVFALIAFTGPKHWINRHCSVIDTPCVITTAHVDGFWVNDRRMVGDGCRSRYDQHGGIKGSAEKGKHVDRRHGVREGNTWVDSGLFAVDVVGHGLTLHCTVQSVVVKVVDARLCVGEPYDGGDIWRVIYGSIGRL